MARLTKQADGRYHTTVVVGHDARGKAIRKPIAGRTLKEIDDKREEVLRHYALGGKARAEVLFGEYAAEWYYAITPTIAEKTADGYKGMLNACLIPIFGNRQMRALTPPIIQQEFNNLANQKYSKSYLAKCRTILNRIFKRAVAEGILPVNPLSVVTMPKTKSKPKVVRRAFTPEETTRILRVGSTHPEGLLLLVLYYTGMRPEEVRGLQAEHIDLKRGVIHVRQAITYVSNRTAEDRSLKTPQSRRDIPIPQVLVRALRKRPVFGDNFLFGALKDPSKPISRTSFHKLWTRLMVQTDTPYITPYWFRHNFTSMMVDRGIQPHELMRVTGHASTNILIKVYYHPTEAGIEAANQKVLSAWE
ncbi:tyrosine-type recombinase/integrase [Gehongia tenuis]|uniref:Site-specific integrase n=1 Tax=Gehongia tenuis TaxID=2763655 RepID=A0A926D6I8_9FIRM|nr:site-specific integrase [Gehongia tenuis]MBC8532166.1 site-specific integrase [Gehongia tenuis]